MSRSGLQARNHVLKLAEWPEADQRAWAQATGPEADIFDPAPRPAMKWRQSTRALTEAGYGRWLAWLAEQDSLAATSLPEHRVTRERVAEYRAALAVTGSDYTVAGRIQQLGNAMRAIAPHADWRWVLVGSSRLRAKAVPASNKAHRMRLPEELAELGETLMHKADTDQHLTHAMRSKMFRDGLMIRLLIHRVFRGANFASITLGLHLVQNGNDWQLRFSGTDTKNCSSVDAPVPTALLAGLQRYLAVYRPRLLASSRKNLPDTDRLWISSHGTEMTYSAISLQIKARTKAAFGVSANPHLFRDCAATAIATDTPELAPDIASVLGHTTMATSERHYNQAKDVTARVRGQDIVARFQRTASSPPRRGHKERDGRGMP